MSFLQRFGLLAFSAAILFSPAPAQAKVSFEPIHTFPMPAWSRPDQCTCLIQAADGSYYGGGIGGPEDRPLIFHLLADGTITILHIFDDVYAPMAPQGLTLGADGSYYGVLGDQAGSGSYTAGWRTFKIAPSGQYTELARFQGVSGLTPVGGLLLASDGNFYGATLGGGAYGQGSIYRMTPAGELSTLCSFQSSTSAHPTTGLAQGPDGNLYGATSGSSNIFEGDPEQGAVFRVTLSGTLTILHHFSDEPGSADAYLAKETMVNGGDGYLYGCSYGGGAGNGGGVIFRVSAAIGEYERVYDLQNDQENVGDLTLGTDGKLYGTLQDGEASVDKIFRLNADKTLSVVAQSPPEPAPRTLIGLHAASGGGFYGFSTQGGDRGAGTLFRVSSTGDFSTLLSLRPRIVTAAPLAMVSQPDGTVYGVTANEGDHECGTFYRIDPNGVTTTLASFDGPSPVELIAGPDGNFYGIGIHQAAGQGDIIFRITPQGQITTLHTQPADNNYADQPRLLTLGPDGNFYGFIGTVFFRMTPAGEMTQFQDLLGPSGTVQSIFSASALICGNDGNLYASLHYSYLSATGGVLKITPNGIATYLADFDTDLNGNLRVPMSLLQAADGNFYGSCFGSTVGNIVVFRLTPTGNLSTFGFVDNSRARLLGDTAGPLVEASGGGFLGLATQGGPYDGGYLFRINAVGETSILRYFHDESGTYPCTLLRAAGNSAYVASLYGGKLQDGSSGGGVISKVTFDSSLSAFDQWLSSQSLTDGPQGDADHDGHCNLEEYAFGTDPKSPAAKTLSVQAGQILSLGFPCVKVNATGIPELLYARRKDAAATGLEYIVDFTSDLYVWYPVPIPGYGTVVASNAEWEVLAIPFNSQGCARVTVNLPQ